MKKRTKLCRIVSMVLAATMTFMLAACGSGETSGDSTLSSAAGTSAETAASAANGKSLVYALNKTSWNTLVPWYATTTNSWMIQRCLYEPLIQAGETELVYCAAESIDVQEDGSYWEVHLNPGVTWHDGTPSTAEDWVWTLETITNPEFGTFTESVQFSNIQGTNELGFLAEGETLGVELIDDYTFSIRWKTPISVEAFVDLSNTWRAAPKHLLENIAVADLGTDEFWTHPVGNGPCIFESEPVTGQEIRFSANKDYYLGTPQWDYVTYVVVDSTNAANAYLNGEIDFCTATLSTEILEELDGQNGLHVERGNSRTISMLSINNSKFNARVRYALSLLIDKQALVDAIAGGDGEPQGDNVLIYLDSYIPYEHVVDVETAKQILEEENFDFTQSIKLGVANGNENTGMIIQQGFQSAGVQCEIISGEFTSILTMQADGDTDCSLQSWYEKFDPVSQYTNFGPETGAYIHTTETKYIELADKIQFCTDEAEKTELIHEWQELLRTECPMIFLYSKPVYFVMSSKLVGGIQSGVMDMPWLWELAE